VRIETLCTGDELLTGLTADTNSRLFQTLVLERLGLTVRRSTVVGDVREDLIEVMHTLAARCDAVLVSGGLGPTTDDLTAECAATAAGVPLVESAEALAHLIARFARRGLELTPNNRRQALVPQGAEVVLNQEGSAPMFVLRLGACRFFFVPGVPREYRHLVELQVLPRLAALLAQRGETPVVRVLRLLKTVGLPESHLDARIRPLLAKYPGVTFGYRTHAPENHLKLLAHGATEAEARALLAQAEAECRPLLGAHLFGVDQETLPEVVNQALRTAGQTVSTVESCTGGLVGAALTTPAGASDVYPGGAITYASALKTQLAQVPPELIAQHTVVSAQVAEAMAAGIRRALHTTFGVATTGYAGPTGGDAVNPLGTVFVAVAREGRVVSERHLFIGDRERVRAFTTHAALDLLRRTQLET
jgi:nicotinamide-nucleotide amidase